MKDLIKIYSHPRSGTHFLEAFLAKNFYTTYDLSSHEDIFYGHWSNKKLLLGGEPYHKLFGSHLFPNNSPMNSKMIYIYRDGRAVIASIWNSKFYNKEWEGISFSEFLRKEIDWYGGLGQKKEMKMNIIQHWYKHTDSWMNLDNKNLMKVSFEQLKNEPNVVFNEISKKFYPSLYIKKLLFGKDINPIKNKVGISPNKAVINSWESLFSEEDLEFFMNHIPSKKYLFDNKL